MSKKDYEEEFEDEDFEEYEDFEDDHDFEDFFKDFEDDDDFEDDEEDDEDDEGEYAPTRDVIAKLLREDENCVHGNKDYVEEAASIIEKWYGEECLTGAPSFKYEEDFLDNGYWDICELTEGQNAIVDEEGARECHIVWMALEGYDPYEDEDEEEEE